MVYQMAMPDFKGGLQKFNKSGEKTVAVGAAGVLTGVLTANYMPKFLGKWSNLVYGIIAIIAGVFIKHDGVGYFLVGLGIAWAVDGACTLIFGKNISMVTATQTPITSLASLKAKF